MLQCASKSHAPDIIRHPLTQNEEVKTSEYISDRAMAVLSRAAKRQVCKQQLMLIKSSTPWKQMTPRSNVTSFGRRRYIGKRSMTSSAPPFMRQPPKITIEEASVAIGGDRSPVVETEDVPDPIYCNSAPPTASSLRRENKIDWEEETPVIVNRQLSPPQYQRRLTRPKYKPQNKPSSRDMTTRPATTDWNWVRSKLLSRDSVKRPDSSMTFEDFLAGLDPDSDEYDTDLEDAYFAEEDEPYDPTGIWHYERLCKLKRVAPAEQVLQKLGKRNIQFRLNHRYIGSKDTATLTDGIKHSEYIKDLDLSNNYLNDCGAKHIANMMRNNRQIYRLDLSSNCFQCDAGRHLAEMILHNRHLTTLCLKNNKLGDKEALLLAEVLRINVTLKSLDVSNNLLSDDAGEAFSAALMDNKSLTSLNLSWNGLRKRAAAAIARALDINTTLLSLDLSWNGVSDEGATLLGHSLRENTTLRFLSLAVNHICAYGAEQLASGICGAVKTTKRRKSRVSLTGQSKCGLQYLALDRNPLGYRGILLLLQKLLQEQTLKTLSIKEVVLNDEILKKIHSLKITSSKDITLLHERQDLMEQKETALRRGTRVLNAALRPLNVKIIDVVNALDNRGLGANTSDLRNVLAEHTTLTELEIERAVDDLDVNNDEIIQYKDVAIYCRGSS